MSTRKSITTGGFDGILVVAASAIVVELPTESTEVFPQFLNLLLLWSAGDVLDRFRNALTEIKAETGVRWMIELRHQLALLVARVHLRADYVLSEKLEGRRVHR
jgi:hypothetical protein